jgi:uncharacterized RDD family membrane protein YckC
MSSELVPIRYPKVPLWRRGAALAVDAVIVGLFSSLMGMSAIAQLVAFMIGWLLLRVAWVVQNKGQSLGRWAFDMVVIDGRLKKIPGLKELFRREGILGLATFLALSGLTNFNPAHPWAPLLLLPLAADCGLAYLDREQQRALHDQWTGTLIVPSRRGYSLDIKLKRLLADLRGRMKK